MNWIGKVSDWMLVPVGLYLTATEWIADNPQKTFWIIVALAVLLVL